MSSCTVDTPARCIMGGFGCWTCPKSLDCIKILKLKLMANKKSFKIKLPSKCCNQVTIITSYGLLMLL